MGQAAALSRDEQVGQENAAGSSQQEDFGQSQLKLGNGHEITFETMMCSTSCCTETSIISSRGKGQIPTPRTNKARTTISAHSRPLRSFSPATAALPTSP